MSAIERDYKKLTFQHYLDNNFGSKQRKISMKLMSVKRECRACTIIIFLICSFVDSFFVICSTYKQYIIRPFIRTLR